jgi:Lrp/AsnC family transcriptional regulator, regulator for asnA, asnC and gidA
MDTITLPESARRLRELAIKHTLDDIDRGIIALLNEDGRMSSAEIARRLGDIPPRTVSYRIEALIHSGIISIRAIVSPDTIGYNVLADVLIEVEPGYLRQVAEQIARFEQVSYVAYATGDRDISIQVLARSNDELFEFVTEELSKIPGVRRTQTHLLPSKIKDIDRWLPPAVLGHPMRGNSSRRAADSALDASGY